MKIRPYLSSLSCLVFLLLLAIGTRLPAQNTPSGPVEKNPNTNAIAEDLVFGASRTLTLSSGAVLIWNNGASLAGDLAAFRAAAGLTIGTNVQAANANLSAIAGLATAADKMIYWTDSGTAATAGVSAFGRSLLDTANAAAARTTLGAGTSNFDGAYASLTGKPTTLAGYGISDGVTVSSLSSQLFALGSVYVPLTDVRLTDARTPLAHSQAISTITGLQTALDAKAPVAVPAESLVGSIRLTYTGTPRTPLLFSLSLPVVSIPAAEAVGTHTYTAPVGVTIASFSYTEGNATEGNVLTTLTFDNLSNVLGAFAPNSMAALTTLSLPALVNVGGNFQPAAMAALTTLNIPSLLNVDGSFTVSFPALATLDAPALTNVGGGIATAQLSALTTLNFPVLETVGSSFAPSGATALTTLSLPALTKVGGGFQPNNMNALTTLSAPALTKVGNNFSVAAMPALTTLNFPVLGTIGKALGADSITMSTLPALTTLSFPALVSATGGISAYNGNGELADVTLGLVGTLKSLGGSVNISGQKLTEASVNGILALLVSLDGTDGTTLWGAGKSVNLSGGTSAAPTGQGLTDKATLIARGATVTTN